VVLGVRPVTPRLKDPVPKLPVAEVERPYANEVP
jgi:hypothetical protein